MELLFFSSSERAHAGLIQGWKEIKEIWYLYRDSNYGGQWLSDIQGLSIESSSKGFPVTASICFLIDDDQALVKKIKTYV